MEREAEEAMMVEVGKHRVAPSVILQMFLLSSS